jgi:hypothetical protein
MTDVVLGRLRSRPAGDQLAAGDHDPAAGNAPPDPPRPPLPLTANPARNAVVVGDWSLPVHGCLTRSVALRRRGCSSAPTCRTGTGPSCRERCWARCSWTATTVGGRGDVGARGRSQGRPITPLADLRPVLLALPRLQGRLRPPPSGLALGVCPTSCGTSPRDRGPALALSGTSVLAPYSFHVGLLCRPVAAAVLGSKQR